MRKLPARSRRRHSSLTPLQLDQEIARYKRAGWSERKIAQKFDMAPSAVHYALGRVKGVPRKSYSYVMCDGCGEDRPRDQVVNGVCAECQVQP